MNVFAKFDEISLMILEVFKETKLETTGRSDGRSHNVKTVYPPTNTVCGGYNKVISLPTYPKCFGRKQEPQIYFI